MRKSLFFMIFLSSILWNPTLSFAQNARNAETKIGYIGTYTKKEGHVDGKADGIYSVIFNPKSGVLEFGDTLAQITNPSFVKTSPNGRYLYAVSELGPNDGPSGRIYSYEVLDNQSLKEINSLPTNGFAPCHIEVDATGEFVFVSNYVGGVVTMYHRDDVGALKEKQVLKFENSEKSHPHSVTLSEDNEVAYIADLGNDKIWIYNFDSEKGKLQAHQQPFIALEEGAGPRHFSISENNDFAYSMNELNSTVSTFKISDTGGLELLQSISSLPKGFEGKNSGADIHLHPSGKFLYVSNRGHNSIAAFSIDKTSGTLEPIGNTPTQGETPRNFAIAPGGAFLLVANQDSGTITSFKINKETGQLAPHLDALEIPTPVCIEF